jgi:hypothetical protein
MAKSPLQKIRTQLDKLEKLHEREEAIVEKITEIIDEEEEKEFDNGAETISDSWEGTG